MPCANSVTIPQRHQDHTHHPAHQSQRFCMLPSCTGSATTTVVSQLCNHNYSNPASTNHAHKHTHTHKSNRQRDPPPPPPPRLRKAGQAYLPHEFTVRPRSEGCRHADTQVSPQGGAGEPGLVKQAAQPHFLEARGVRIPGIQLFFFSFLHYTTEA